MELKISGLSSQPLCLMSHLLSPVSVYKGFSHLTLKTKVLGILVCLFVCFGDFEVYL